MACRSGVLLAVGNRDMSTTFRFFLFVFSQNRRASCSLQTHYRTIALNFRLRYPDSRIEHLFVYDFIPELNAGKSTRVNVKLPITTTRHNLRFDESRRSFFRAAAQPSSPE